MALTKPQLIARILDLTGCNKTAVSDVLDALSATITDQLRAGEPITLPGIGKLSAKTRPERQVRNPATGETMTKAADKQVKFTAAKALKDAVQA